MVTTNQTCPITGTVYALTRFDFDRLLKKKMFMNYEFAKHESYTAIRGLKPLPHKFYDLSKLNKFADDKINLIQAMKYVFGKVKRIVGKGENAGYQHFLLFPQCFQKVSFSGSLKVRIVC